MKNFFQIIKKRLFKKESEKGTNARASKEHSLERFVEIQELMFERALSEVKSGRKTTHWIWFIFPQLKGLGTSLKAHYFGIDNIEEATAYIQHSVLANNLRTITVALLELDGYSANDIFSELDSIKVRSSMTLFDVVSPNDVFAKVLDKYYNSSRCELTLKMLQASTDAHMKML